MPTGLTVLLLDFGILMRISGRMCMRRMGSAIWILRNSSVHSEIRDVQAHVRLIFVQIAMNHPENLRSEGVTIF